MRPMIALLAAGALAAPMAHAKDDVVREVVHGGYLKASVGSTIFAGPRGSQGIVDPGTTLVISGGYDFYNASNFTVSGELSLYTSMHSGMDWQVQAGAITDPNLRTQGDILLVGGLAMFQMNFFPTRRFGVGPRIGGGVNFAPLLIPEDEYLDKVIGGAYGGFGTPVHDGTLPTVGGGVNIEYFTKLSHFSLGATVDVLYIVGMDVGVFPAGYFKYTF